MQNHSEIGDEMLAEIVGRRWARFQARQWPSGEVQAADMQARGVKVDARTVNGWRQGQLPSNRHKIQLMRAGFKSMLDRSFEPADAAGRISELEARIEQEKSATRAAEMELARIRAAFEGQSFDDVG